MTRIWSFISDWKIRQNKLITKSIESELDFLNLAPKSYATLRKLCQIEIEALLRGIE